MKLGTLLLRDAVISLNHLEAGLRMQVLYGGRLGTNLVEIGALDVDTLGEYLAQILDLPLATKDMFEEADRAVVEGFDGALADLYGAFPLGLEQDGKTLAVALVDPRSESTVEQLARQCGHPVAPYVAAELRILYYLEKHYGITRKARYVRTGALHAAPAPSVDERRRTQAPGGIEMPPPVRFEPTSKRNPSEPGDPALPEARLGYREACDALDAAAHRDHIGDALTDFAVGRFEVAVVFLLRDQNALGWRAASALEGADRPPIEELALPLGGTSALQAACDSGTPFRGASPSAGQPVEKRLWEALGVPRPPAEMLVVPILVKQRVVNLVYAHGPGGQPLSDQHVDELVELCVRSSDAYIRLIHAAKLGARADDATVPHPDDATVPHPDD
jgi:hypothetical protein